MAKRYKWLKLKDDFFNQKEIKKIRRIAGGDTYTIIYLKLQLLSLKGEGSLFYDELEDTFYKELALEIDEEEENVNIAIGLFMKYGLLDVIDTDEYLMNKVPELIGSECDSAERVRKCRKNKAEQEKTLQCNENMLLGNTSVTMCNTEKEKEKDIEKDTDIEKRKKKTKGAKAAPGVYYPNDELLDKAFKDYIENRKALKKPMTDRAIELAMNNLEKLASDNDTKIAILNQSIEGGWSGLYELKTSQRQGKTNWNQPINWDEV